MNILNKARPRAGTKYLTVWLARVASVWDLKPVIGYLRTDRKLEIFLPAGLRYGTVYNKDLSITKISQCASNIVYKNNQTRSCAPKKLPKTK